MKRAAAILAAALAASGCFITDDTPSQGSVNLYWDFVRNAPAQPAGYVIYDQDLVGVGDQACAESGVETVDVTSPAGTLTFPCTYSGVQGVTLDLLPAGNQTFRVRGWRTDGGVERLLWDHTVTAQVVGGRTVDVYVDVEPLSADIDVFAYFTYGANQDYGSCAAAESPVVTYDVFDSWGTKILTTSAGVACTAYPLPAIVDRLDLDYYSIRLKGFTGAPSVRTFDSCLSESQKYWEFDHYAAATGVNGQAFDLYTPPACSATP